MKLPLRFGSEYLEARIEHVTRPKFGFLSEWRKSLGQDKHPIRRDAVEFAELACKRFSTHSSAEIYAQRIEDIEAHTVDNPNCEVANLVVMKCESFSESDVVGVAHFRRSWCNNLILDYLAAHPWIASRPPHFQSEVSGVGVGLMCYLSDIGARLGSRVIWGEATQNSWKVYKKFFDLESVEDLLHIPREEFMEFGTSVKDKWKGKLK